MGHQPVQVNYSLHPTLKGSLLYVARLAGFVV